MYTTKHNESNYRISDDELYVLLDIDFRAGTFSIFASELKMGFMFEGRDPDQQRRIALLVAHACEVARLRLSEEGANENKS